MPCVTAQIDPIGRAIINVVIKPSTAFRTATKQADNKQEVVKALIDTGANGSCIDASIANKLGLQPKGAVQASIAHGTKIEEFSCQRM